LKILWLTWKDYAHPTAGGAEVVCRELTRRLLAEGHAVTILTCSYDGATKRERLDGMDIIRVGSNRYTHPFRALIYYLRHLRGKFDIVIEEVNGSAPYFSVLFERRARKFLLYHQLSRINWLYEIPAPFDLLGYHVLAPAATRLASWTRTPVITVSESSRQTLANHGFQPERTHIITEGIQIEPLQDLNVINKFSRPTILSLGAMRTMKRTLDQVKAFELAKQYMPGLQLKMAGSSASSYGQKVLNYIQQSPYSHDIEYLGHVSNEEKITLLQRSHLTLQTAIEEGWGLTITEAASQGTPAIAYDVDGLRDSVRHRKTGIITSPHPETLSRRIVELLSDQVLYARLRTAAWQWSKELTFDQSYKDFKKVLELV
jgi:glycosyltransferase involved in cell wall biosynthesis